MTLSTSCQAEVKFEEVEKQRKHNMTAIQLKKGIDKKVELNFTATCLSSK